MSNVSNPTMIIHYTNAFSYVVLYISVVTFIIIIVVILYNMYMGTDLKTIEHSRHSWAAVVSKIILCFTCFRR